MYNGHYFEVPRVAVVDRFDCIYNLNLKLLRMPKQFTSNVMLVVQRGIGIEKIGEDGNWCQTFGESSHGKISHILSSDSFCKEQQQLNLIEILGNIFIYSLYVCLSLSLCVFSLYVCLSVFLFEDHLHLVF